MAAAADVITAPSPRSVAASLARAVSRLAPAAADALLCLCLADIWLLFAGAVPVDIGRITGAEDRAVAVAASKVVDFCEFYFLLAWAHGAMIFVKRLHTYDADEVKGPVPDRLAAGWEEVKCYTVIFAFYACVPFIVLIMAGELLLEMKVSRWEAIGFVARAAGHLGKNALICFVIIPTVALKVWRVTRPGLPSDSTFAKNP